MKALIIQLSVTMLLGRCAHVYHAGIAVYLPASASGTVGVPNHAIFAKRLVSGGPVTAVNGPNTSTVFSSGSNSDCNSTVADFVFKRDTPTEAYIEALLLNLTTRTAYKSVRLSFASSNHGLHHEDLIDSNYWSFAKDVTLSGTVKIKGDEISKALSQNGDYLFMWVEARGRGQAIGLSCLPGM